MPPGSDPQESVLKRLRRGLRPLKNWAVGLYRETDFARNAEHRRLHAAAASEASANGLTYEALADAYRISGASGEIVLPLSQERQILTAIRQFQTYVDAIDANDGSGRKIMDFRQPGWFVLAGSGRRVFLNSFTEGEQVVENYLGAVGSLDGATVLDVGANAGIVSLALADRVGPSGKVVAVEADPTTFEILCKNVEGRENIVPLNVALWTQPGSIPFRVEGTMGSGVARKGDANIHHVECRTLAQLQDEYGQFSYIKIDIEGAEFDILPRSRQFITDSPAEWVIEVHDSRNGPRIMSEIFDRHTISTREDGPAPVMAFSPSA